MKSLIIFSLAAGLELFLTSNPVYADSLCSLLAQNKQATVRYGGYSVNPLAFFGFKNAKPEGIGRFNATMDNGLVTLTDKLSFITLDLKNLTIKSNPNFYTTTIYCSQNPKDCIQAMNDGYFRDIVHQAELFRLDSESGTDQTNGYCLEFVFDGFAKKVKGKIIDKTDNQETLTVPTTDRPDEFNFDIAVGSAFNEALGQPVQ